MGVKMKKGLTLTLTLVVFLSITSICVGSWVEVVIDPGHGGPDASKFGNNGGGYNEGHGALGPNSQLTEQWVNLQVAFFLRDSITFFFGDTGYVIMTGYTEQRNPTYWQRVNTANYANGTSPAYEFISIHHNGLPLNAQGTEVWWSSTWVTDSSYWRAYDDSILALKINSRLINKWGYSDRCAYSRNDPNHKCTFCCNDCCYRPGGSLTCCVQESIRFVLRNTICEAALSEASNLNNVEEELLFLDTTMSHIKEEASAIFQGWSSYIQEAGIAIVKNSYEKGEGSDVIIEDWSATIDSCLNRHYYPSPYSAC
jgi:N-acetylmuramoyl-L-alanine amidase